MAGFSMRRQRAPINAWPGWVDALATLVMVVMFLLMVFMIAQFYLREALSGRESQLKQLSGRMSEIADILSMERQTNADLRANLERLSSQLQASVKERDDLSTRLGQITGRLEAAETEAWKAQQKTADATKTITANRDTIEMQIKQIAALQQARDELAKRLAEESAKLKITETESGKVAQQLRESTRTAEAGRERIEALVKDIAGLQALKSRLEAEVKDRNTAAKTAEERIRELDLRLLESGRSLMAEKNLSIRARDELALLNQQIAALREQVTRLGAALELSEQKGKEQDVQISDLGKRLNVALASRVQELERYRSEFLGKLREALGERPDIRVVGDRFIFQSEVLFESGSAQLGAPGQEQLSRLAATLKEIAAKIPADINWVLRVDGHTDKRPIATPQFPSNWELSTGRAISVVRYLVGAGVPAERLAAAGFGEFQPIDGREDEIGLKRNRRIELKLDQR